MKKIYALFMTLCLIISATAAPLAGVAKKSYPLYQPQVVKAELAPSMHKAPAATQGLQYDAEAGELIRYYNETDQIAIDANYLAQGNLYIDIMAGDKSDYLTLLLFVEDTVEGAIIPEGTYPITSTPAYNTALASQGYVAGEGVYPCAYYPLVEQGGTLYINTPMYFMQSGNIVVEHVNGAPKITINAVNSNNVPMTIVYEVGGKSEKVEVKTPLQYDATAAVEDEIEYETFIMSNLEITNMGDFDLLEASDDMNGLAATLGVYADGSLHEASAIEFMGEDLPIVEGNVTKAYNEEVATDVYTARLVVDFMGNKLGLELLMYAGASASEIEVVIEGAAAVVDETTGVLQFTATWTDSTTMVTYPVLLTVAGFEDVEFKEYEGAQVSELQIGDDDNWFDFAVANAVAVFKDGNAVAIEAEYTSRATGATYYVYAEGVMQGGETSEYEVHEDEITNLVIDYDNMLLIGGPSTNFQVEVVLGLGDYDRNTDAFQLLPESMISIYGTEATFIDGYASVDGIEQSATAVVHCTWNGMAIEFHLTMSATPLEPTVVVVENAVVEIEKVLLFGDMYDYALKMTGVWTNEGIDYPVLVEVPVYYPEATEPSEIYSTVTVGGWEDDDPWLGFGEGTLTVTTVDNVVTATGIVQNPGAGIAIDITISGTIVTTGLENATVTVKPVKVLKNGQLIIIKDGVEYSAQGAVVK